MSKTIVINDESFESSVLSFAKEEEQDSQEYNKQEDYVYQVFRPPFV